MAGLIAELEPVEGPLPGVAVRDGSGWTLSAFPTDLVTWENVETGQAERTAFLSIDELRSAFDNVARGHIEPVQSLLDRVTASASERIQELAAEFRALGADDPDSWARSEVVENFAQEARFLFLRSLWPNLIEAYADPEVLARYPAFERLIEAGANTDDLSRAARAVAFETVGGLLYHLDYGVDDEAPIGAPGWRLMETRDDRLTGRNVGLLHESLQEFDTSGNEALDLFE